MPSSNPYADYSAPANDAVADTTDATAGSHNQQAETARRIVEGQQFKLQSGLLVNINEPFLERVWGRGGLDLPSLLWRTMNDQVAFAGNTAEFLDACKLVGPRVPGSSRQFRSIYARPGAVIGEVGKGIPSCTKIVGFTFAEGVDISGIFQTSVGVSAEAQSVLTFSTATDKRADAWRPGDIVTSPDMTPGISTFTEIYDAMIDIKNTIRIATNWSANVTGTDYVAVMKSEIIFEDCIFLGTVNTSHSYNCKFRRCAFINDDFNSFNGKLDNSGTTLVTREDSHFHLVLDECLFIYNGEQITTPNVIMQGYCIGVLMKNCHLYAEVNMTTSPPNVNPISFPGADVTYGGIMMGCQFGGAANDKRTLAPNGTTGTPTSSDDPKFYFDFWIGAGAPPKINIKDNQTF